MSSEQRIEKQDTAAFLTGSALLSRSLAPSHIFMSPTFFSPLSPPFCPSACLSHSAAAVSILYSVCYFWMKPFLMQPACKPHWSQTPTSWLGLYSGHAHTWRKPGVDTQKREKQRERWDKKNTVAQERLLELLMYFGFITESPIGFSCFSLFSLEDMHIGFELSAMSYYIKLEFGDPKIQCNFEWQCKWQWIMTYSKPL